MNTTMKTLPAGTAVQCGNEKGYVAGPAYPAYRGLSRVYVLWLGAIRPMSEYVMSLTVLSIPKHGGWFMDRHGRTLQSVNFNRPYGPRYHAGFVTTPNGHLIPTILAPSSL